MAIKILIKTASEPSTKIGRITVDAIKPNAAFSRLYRIDGDPVALVRETTPEEREYVHDAAYAATWLSWHDGQVPGYGSTPQAAVKRLAQGHDV